MKNTLRSSTILRLGGGLVFVLLGASVDAAPTDALITHAFRSNGVLRTYCVHKGPASDGPVPLVVVLHGDGGSGRLLKDNYGFKPFIETGEFIAVYPNSIEGQWMPTDEELAFLDAVIDQVLAAEPVDPSRLFVTGASRGGIMTFVMAARSRHKICAAGSVSASLPQFVADDFQLPRHIDFAMINGTADPLMPYSGGWGGKGKPMPTGEPERKLMPVEEVVRMLVKANGISGEPVVTSLGNADKDDGCTNEVQSWTDSQTGSRVMLVKVWGGGHVPPGGKQYQHRGLVGPRCNDFDHAQVMWDFFRSADERASEN